MIIRPDFYERQPIDRRAEMQRQGLDPARPTGIVLFGGHGSKAMCRIARRLDDVQLILVCGHHAALAERLRAMEPSAPRAIIGFTPRIRYYMQLSDFFIGKPGPASISEAVQQGLPVIVVRNAWTMPQERYNTDWVRETGAGVAALTEQIDAYRDSIKRIDNRAVFEIPDLLERILLEARRVPPRPRARMSIALH